MARPYHSEKLYLKVTGALSLPSDMVRTISPYNSKTNTLPLIFSSHTARCRSRITQIRIVSLINVLFYVNFREAVVFIFAQWLRTEDN